MATKGKSLLSLGNKLHHCFQIRPFMTTQVRCTTYPSNFQEPTFLKEDLAIPLDEQDERRFQPIKAARNDQFSASYYDPLVQKFVRLLLKKSDKILARHLVDKTFENVKLIQLEKYYKASSELERDLIELNPVNIFHQAVENCKPLLILQTVKRGGTIYQVPIPVRPNYQLFRAMNWLIESGTEKERTVRFHDKLASELIDAARNEGKSVRKKQELHKLCEANRAYAHFRW